VTRARRRLFGLHTSTAGGLDNAAREALEFGANCFQIFSSSPRTWRASPLDPTRIEAFHALRQKHDLGPVAIHCNYLINLAATDENVLRQSMMSFRGELERALAIGAEYLVLHPGSKKGHASPGDAVLLAAASIAAASKGLAFPAAGQGFRLLLENTAGAGQSIGSAFEELASLSELAQRAGAQMQIGYCIDTCHCLAAGYDVASEAGLDETVRSLDRALGLDNVPMFHANDSKGALGSHLDRHANIGDGHIGLDGFRRILNHPHLADKAFILETPADDGGAERDLATLRKLTSGG
jgi:deoxyribonuclease-4